MQLPSCRHRAGLLLPLLLALLGSRLALAQAPGVGIGTTAPDASAALDIVSSSKGVLLPRVASAAAIANPAPGLLVYQTGTPAGFYYNSGNAATPSWQQLGTTTNGDNLGNHTATQNLNLADKLLVGNGGTTGLALTSAGRLGVGTSSPVTQLANSADNVIATDGNGVSAQALNWVSPATGYAAGLANTNAAANGHGLALKVRSASAGTAALDISQGSDLATAGTPLLRVRGDGQVGVGTASPTQRLDVAGGILARSNGPISNQGAHLQWNRTGGDGETWLLNQRGGGGGGIRFGSATTANAVTEWARFEGDGRLGLGTTSPAGQLDVYGLPGFGTAGADQGSLTTTGYFYINQGSSAAQSFTAGASGQLQQLQLVVAGDNGGLLEPSDLRVEVYAGASASGVVLASATQNVPEQTVAPPPPTTFTFAAPAVLVSGQPYSFRLSRVGGAPGIRGYVNRNAYAGGDYLGEPGYDQTFLTFVAGATAARSALVVQGNNVGIGTTAPGTMLDVRSPDNSAALTVGSTGGGAGALYLGNANHGLKRNYGGGGNDVGLYTTSGSLYLSAAGGSTSQFALTSGGSVGLGLSSAPLARLHVNGVALFGGGALPNTGNATGLGWNAVNPGVGESELYNYRGSGSGGFRFFSVPNSGVPASGNQVAFINTAGVYSALSDRRVKTNITPLGQGLRTVLALRPVSYDFHPSRQLQDGVVTFLPDDKPVRALGFVAQDLLQVVPEAVEKPADDCKEFYTVSYTTLVPVLTQAIQEQQAQIETLQRELAAARAKAATAEADHAELQTLKAAATQTTATLEGLAQRLRALEAGGGQARQ